MYRSRLGTLSSAVVPTGRSSGTRGGNFALLMMTSPSSSSTNFCMQQLRWCSSRNSSSGSTRKGATTYFPTSDPNTLSRVAFSSLGPFAPEHSLLISGFPGLWRVVDVASFLHTLIVAGFQRRSRGSGGGGGVQFPERIFSPEAETKGFFRDPDSIGEREGAEAFLEGYIEGVVFRTYGKGGAISTKEAYVLVSNAQEVIPVLMQELKTIQQSGVSGLAVNNSRISSSGGDDADVREDPAGRDVEVGRTQQMDRQTDEEDFPFRLPEEDQGAGSLASEEESSDAAFEKMEQEETIDSYLTRVCRAVEISPGVKAVDEQARSYFEAAEANAHPDSVFPSQFSRRVATGSSATEKALAMEHMSLDRYLLSPDLLLEKDLMHTKRYTRAGVDAIPSFLATSEDGYSLAEEGEDDEEGELYDDDDGADREEDFEGQNNNRKRVKNRKTLKTLDDDSWIMQPRRSKLLSSSSYDHDGDAALPPSKPQDSIDATAHPYGPGYNTRGW